MPDPVGFEELSSEEQQLYRSQTEPPEKDPDPEPERETGEEPVAREVPDQYEKLKPELEKLPAELKSYVDELRQSNVGQRRALARRSQRLEQAIKDREEALRVAVEAHRSVDRKQEPVQPADSSKLPVLYDEEKQEYYFEPVALDRLVEQRLQKIQEPHIQRAQRERERVEMVRQIAKQHEVSPDLEQQFADAYGEIAAGVEEAVRLGAVSPRTPLEAIRLIRDEGIGERATKRYGLDVEDVIDVAMGSIDPWRHGHAMGRALRRYAQTPNGEPAQKPRAPEVRGVVQSRSIARRGSPPTTPRRPIDEIVDADSESLLAMKPEEIRAKVRAWEAELRR